MVFAQQKNQRLYWQACDRSRGFSRTCSRERLQRIFLSHQWMPPFSGHQTTLPTVHSGWLARDLDCTMTELHSEGWKGWVYEYQNLWEICDVNRIYCNLVGAARFYAADTKLGISVQPNYPHTQYVGLRPTSTHPDTHTNIYMLRPDSQPLTGFQAGQGN